MALTDKLTAIADPIRGIVGSTEKMSLDTMASQLNGAVTEIDVTQADLISQIASALEGKAAGGGGDDELKASFIGTVERSATEIAVPEGVTKIGSYAFCDCTGLVLTELPEGVTNIENNAFQNCYKVALKKLPDELTKLGNFAFNNCTSLALTELPDGIKSIGSNTFSGCTGLTELTFKGTPTSIKNNAFSTCTNLTTINVPWAEGEVAGSPWGATSATINYNVTV